SHKSHRARAHRRRKGLGGGEEGGGGGGGGRASHAAGAARHSRAGEHSGLGPPAPARWRASENSRWRTAATTLGGPPEGGRQVGRASSEGSEGLPPQKAWKPSEKPSKPSPKLRRCLNRPALSLHPWARRRRSSAQPSCSGSGAIFIRSSMRRMVIAASVANFSDLSLETMGSRTPAATESRTPPLVRSSPYHL
ncbi:unnamed protein product, partial [Prorocentrum cordatum]